MTDTIAMANLRVDPAVPVLTSEQSLTGWRRELCVQLLGESEARIYLRAVESPSMKADELRQAILFHRVGVGVERLALRSVAFDAPGLPVDTHVGRLCGWRVILPTARSPPCSTASGSVPVSGQAFSLSRTCVLLGGEAYLFRRLPLTALQ